MWCKIKLAQITTETRGSSWIIMDHRRFFLGKLGDPTPNCLQQQTRWILHGCLCSGFVNDQGKGREDNRFYWASGKDENMLL
jgi:hypothetical protein